MLSEKTKDSELDGLIPDFKTGIGYKLNDKEADNNYIIPIFATYTTSYSRIALHKLIKESQAVYTDSDSLVTLKEMPTSDDLGGLKLEMISKTGYIIRPKIYSLINELDNNKYTKIKGINVKSSKKKREDLLNEMLQDILNGKKVAQIQFIKIKQALNQNYSPNQIRKFTKEVNLNDDKREWKKPFNKNEWQESTPIFINDTKKYKYKRELET